MKKKGGGPLAGIPRASGERSSPVGNGLTAREVCILSLYPPPSRLFFFFSIILAWFSPLFPRGRKSAIGKLPSGLLFPCSHHLISGVASVTKPTQNQETPKKCVCACRAVRWEENGGHFSGKRFPNFAEISRTNHLWRLAHSAHPCSWLLTHTHPHCCAHLPIPRHCHHRHRSNFLFQALLMPPC